MLLNEAVILGQFSFTKGFTIDWKPLLHLGHSSCEPLKRDRDICTSALKVTVIQAYIDVCVFFEQNCIELAALQLCCPGSSQGFLLIQQRLACLIFKQQCHTTIDTGIHV